MSIPKSHHTKSRVRRRRSHIALKTPALVGCARCGKQIVSHRVCPNCGYYKGRMILNVLAKLEKSEKKKREKAMALKEKETKKEENLDMKKMSEKI